MGQELSGSLRNRPAEIVGLFSFLKNNPDGIGFLSKDLGENGNELNKHSYMGDTWQVIQSKVKRKIY